MAMVVGCTTSNGSASRPAPADIAPAAEASREATRDNGIAPTNGQLAPTAQTPFDSTRAWKDLQAQVAIGPRPAGSAALQKTRDYILAELKKAGVETRQQVFIAKTPLGETSMANLIATIPGRRPERIAIASHYDTKLFRDIRFVGASDGASSTAALLELARVLKSRQNEFTLELLFFDGEEAVVEWGRNNDNTYGSRYYVDAARKAGTLKDLRALVLLDMIGDKDLIIRRDGASTPWLVDIAASSPTSSPPSTMTTCHLSWRAYRPWTSSISITPPGTPPLTRWTTSVPAACRSSATLCSPLSPTSKPNFASRIRGLKLSLVKHRHGALLCPRQNAFDREHDHR